MRTTLKVTLDGLVRALRARAHDLADAAEQGYVSSRRTGTEPAPDPIMRPKLAKELADDRARR